ncbi:MAG TPA: hypothetical protein DEO84_04535 [candidate division Zixibacteria bacterium]|nr:hypothetical protein [candidate division Zixibacteria bacterium]HBZ00573.1 hypothetical protein [candidate division Zixibacteria bacterium]
MRKLLIVLFLMLPITIWASSAPRISNEFTTINAKRAIRSMTPGEGHIQAMSRSQAPFRNPHLMAQVLWVDRLHENAIADNVTVTPDGSGVFAGWWLNNMRYAAYASAGLETPVWKYYQDTPWSLPVASSNTNFAGTGSELPAFLWEKDSPLYIREMGAGPGSNGAGVKFSGNGEILASVFTQGANDALLIVSDVATGDTIYTRPFYQARGLYGIDMARDGSVAVVSCYDSIYVFDIPDGNYRGALYNYSQLTAKVSGDGNRIASGTYSGDVFCWVWDGAIYNMAWAGATANDWVSAVDISDDGTTVACGTLDFLSGGGYAGKFMEWDSSGTVLIEYGEYGDMVASVALSADGQYAIAGSWGTYDATYGDVVTCFMRGVDIPIFQLQDDLDEPGSVFSVAISDSGHYAAAGGKAVHARTFGNGGMLYAIQVRDPFTHDVAVSSIDSPGEFATPGSSITPTATFINVGTAVANFNVYCMITNIDSSEVIYEASSGVANLSSFSTEQVTFAPDFTAPSDGRYRVSFLATMAGDQDISNNTLELVSRSWHDLKGISISSPFDESTVNWPLTPIATFKNTGSYNESADITLSILDSTDVEVFSTIYTLFDLAPYAEESMEFESWVPSAIGNYRAVFTAEVSGDHTPDDNIISKNFTVVNEMMYDDGGIESAFYVGDYPSTTNRKFGQRFEPNIPAPFTVTNVRFFLPANPFTGTFDYLGISGDIDNLPDTGAFYQTIENLELPEPGNWASYDFNYTASDDNPLWVVLHWADESATGPYVGADYTAPINHNSYWYSDENAPGWSLWQWSDWMIRMTLQQPTGVETDIVAGLPTTISLKQNYPNPFNPSTRIEYALPNAGNVRLEIYNNLGQKIKTLVNSYTDAGYHSAIWDGKTDAGAGVASGLYYYKLTCGDYRISKRMTMLK